MDIQSRILTLQQVMSTFVFTCPKNSMVILSSAENYHQWHNSLVNNITSYGVGLVEFFQTGDLSIAAEQQTDGAGIALLTVTLNNAVQVILNHTIKGDIISRFQADGLTGLTLLAAIRRDYSALSPRQFHKMVGDLLKVGSKTPAEAAKFLRTVRVQFNHGLTVDHLFGLIYLQSFQSDDAVRRIIDAPTPNLEFTAIERALQDLTVPTTNPNQAFAAAASSSSTSTSAGTASSSRKKKKADYICRRCHAKGHSSVTCTAPAPVPKPSSGHASTSDSQQISWSAGVSTAINDETYTLDSGSTLHLTRFKEHFVDFIPLSGGEISGIGDSSVTIEGYGTIIFDLGNGNTLKISNVAYAPKATRNLLSVKLITEKTNLDIIFGATKCTLSNGMVLGTYLTGTLYQFNYSPVVNIPTALSAVPASQIWHARLGHPSASVMHSIGYDSPTDVKLCTHCCAGNMTRTYPKLATTKTIAPLELLHVDICGSIPVPGLHGEKFFLTIVDDFTRWSSIIPLIQKSDAATELKKFILFSENQFVTAGFKVLKVRSDNGGEFCNGGLDNYFIEKGIVHQLTVPYNSSQNGVAERKHRTVQEKARTLLSSSGLSDKFWSEAAKMAEFLINRYPIVRFGGVSSFEKWFGYAPDYNVFHPFGCYCMVFIPPEKRSTIFSPVSSPGILVGYSPFHKAYRCYIFAVNDVVVSNNVRFDDNVFPMLNSSVPSSSTNHFNAEIFNAGSIDSDIYFGGSAGGIPFIPTSSGYSSESDYSTANDASFDSPSPVPPSPSSTGSVANIMVSQDVSVSNSDVIVSQDVSDSNSDGIVSQDISGSNSDVMVSQDATSDSVARSSTSSPIGPIVSNFPDPASSPSDANVNDPADVTDVFTTFHSTDPIHNVPIERSLIPRCRSRSTVSTLSTELPPARRVQIHPILPADSPPFDPLATTDSETEAEQALFSGINEVHNAFSTVLAIGQTPSSFLDAMRSAESLLWKAAVKVELDAHNTNNTWTFVDLPPGRRAIGNRWVFAIKDHQNPPVYKARLVVQGFRQIHGLDYFETFAPVVRYESIRIIFALAAQFGLVIHQMDVTTAFLNGRLDEEIYMKIPDGVDAPAGMVCKLNKSLYGLKQAPLCWNNAINKVLVGAGFNRSLVEYGVYSYSNGSGAVVLVALYVDDLLICSNSPDLIQGVKDLLSSNYKMKDLGLVTTFLGMQIDQSSANVTVKLSHYLSGILSEFGLSDCNSVTTPFAAGTDFAPGLDLSDDNVTCFRSMVGKLLFAANTCRPDLAYAASTLSRFIKDPKANHLAAAKHVLRYIKGTLNFGLTFTHVVDFSLVGFSDSDWAGDKLDRKSITGYVFTLAGAAITWKTKKQQTVALSSTEAEYMALGDAVKELLWLFQLLLQIGLKFNSVPVIYEDNEGCRLLSNHPSHHQRTKHIDIRHHFIRDHVRLNHLQILQIRTDEMLADMFTKNLGRLKFKRFVELIGVTNI